MGIKITTDDYGVKVWRFDQHGFPQYAVALSGKMEDGTKKTMYQQVVFRQGVELENGEEIFIRNAFPKLRIWRSKKDKLLHTKEIWMVTDFVYKTSNTQPDYSQAQNTQPNYSGAQQETFSSFDDMPETFAAAEDDIPF